MLQFPRFKENQQLVCKMDLESIIITRLLVKYKNCEIVGFCNDKHVILIRENIELTKVLFINETVLKPEYHSYSTMIVSFDINHNNVLLKDYDIINPNLFKYKHINTFAISSSRFPFSSLLFTIALLESEGIDLSKDINIKKENYVGKLGLKWFTTADFILLFNNMFDKNEKNKQNINEWYNWIGNVLYGGKLNKDCVFYQLVEYLNDTKNIEFWNNPKTTKLKNYFSKNFIIDSYMAFDEEQLIESTIINDCINKSSEIIFKDNNYISELEIEPIEIYRMNYFFGEPNTKTTHDLFFFQFFSLSKVKYSYNLQKII